MSALHDAARRVVAAWVSTRPAWIEQCNAAVMALDAALKAQAEPTVTPAASRLKMHSHEVPTTMRTELHSWEKAVLGPPHPNDFGIPKEHWEAAQHYANYWNENRAKAQPPEPAQEPVAWMVYTEDGKSVCVTDNPADFAGEHRALPLYTAPPKPEPVLKAEPVLVVEKEPDYWSGGHFHQGSKSHIDPTKVWNLPIGAKLYTDPPQRPPLTDEEIDKATAQERDALLDHIYEYGTAAEGVLERIRKLCRAIERKVRGEKE